MNFFQSASILLAGTLGAGEAAAAGNAFIELPAVADTTLIEYAPDNNMGHQPFANAGSTRVSLTGSSLPTRNRALMLFDLSQVPPGSRIVRAELHVEVTGEPIPGNGAASLFALHRMLRNWGEGTKVSSLISPGLGAVATIGEATWTSPFALTGTNWAAPGGAPHVDYVAGVSASQFIEDVSDYVFSSEEEMAADVQLWLDAPGENFGWMLRSLAETTRGTARRFGSREDGNNVARLVLEYLPPPSIDSFGLVGDQIEIHFSGQAGYGYTVEYGLMMPVQEWMTLRTFDPLDADGTLVVTDSATNALRFYRVGRVP